MKRPEVTTLDRFKAYFTNYVLIYFQILGGAITLHDSVSSITAKTERGVTNSVALTIVSLLATVGVNHLHRELKAWKKENGL